MTLLTTSLLLLVSPFALGHPDDDPSGDPYIIEHELTGSIGCAIGANPVVTRDLCAPFDPNAKSDFTFPLDASVTGFAFYLDSEDRPLAVSHLQVLLRTPEGTYDTLRGPTPLTAIYSFDEANGWPGWPEPTDLDLRIRIDNGGSPQVAIQQRLDLCVGMFYNGAEVPDDYACP